jgi:epoxyqueuosine reductase
MDGRRRSTQDRSAASESIRRRALELGFELLGIAPAQPPTNAAYFLTWLERGYAGEMTYLTRPDTIRRRLDPQQALTGARAVICVAMNYNNGDSDPSDDPSQPVVARYARGADYHGVFEERLEKLTQSMTDLLGGDVRTLCYVDYGPVLERDHAQRAGLGWIGKNTMLINPKIGSYFFLGVVLTNADIESDEPFLSDHCGTCDRCIVACPTGAIRSPRELDSRLCISYLTIELRGPIPRDLRKLIGNRIFGCDICQETCPWNREAPSTKEPQFEPRLSTTGSSLIELLELTEDGFKERFGDTPVARAKRRGLLRNVAVALGNWGDPSVVHSLVRALDDREPLVRGHAAWALGQTGGRTAHTGLQARLQQEEDDWVRSEIRDALACMSRAPRSPKPG